MLATLLTVKTALVGVVVFLLIFYVFKRIHFRLKYRLPPGPTPIPLLGNLLKFASGDTVQTFSNMVKQYGAVFGFWIGPIHVISLNTMEAIDEALVKKATDFAGRPHLKSMDRFTKGGKDIALADYGPVWRVQRKIAHVAMRTFTEGDKLTQCLQENFKDMANNWKSETEAFDPRETIALFTYNIMMSMIFSEKFEKDNEEFQQLVKFGTEGIEVIGNGFASDFLPDWLEFVDKKKIEYMDHAMEQTFDKMITIRIKKHRDNFDPDNLHDLVDHILAVEEKAKTEEDSSVMSQLTDDHFNMIILDLFGAGTDTTRETLIFLLLYAGSHPDVQEKMAEELDRVVGRDRLPEAKDVPHLRYVEAVVFETMRYSSIAPVSLPHQTMCDTSVGGYDVPKGSMVLINLLGLHFDPKHWTNPDEFNPDRFIDEDGSITKPRAWMPFSGGRRVCPGESLAKRELIYIAALIFHEFSVKIPEIPEKPLEPADPVSIIGRLPKPFKMSVLERK